MSQATASNGAGLLATVTVVDATVQTSAADTLATAPYENNLSLLMVISSPFRYREPLVVCALFVPTHTGCTNAPLPAESHTANRTHCLPVASKGIENFLELNGGSSVAGMIWRSTFLPSPHPTSTKRRGIVSSKSAPIVR